MKLLMVVLNDETLVEPLLALLKENGISGGTLIETKGMHSLLYDLHPEQIPLFASFRMWMGNLHPNNRTFFSVIQDDYEEKALKIISDLFNQRGKGIAFTLKVDNAVGISFDR